MGAAKKSKGTSSFVLRPEEGDTSSLATNSDISGGNTWEGLGVPTSTFITHGGTPHPKPAPSDSQHMLQPFIPRDSARILLRDLVKDWVSLRAFTQELTGYRDRKSRQIIHMLEPEAELHLLPIPM